MTVHLNSWGQLYVHMCICTYCMSLLCKVERFFSCISVCDTFICTVIWGESSIVRTFSCTTGEQAFWMKVSLFVPSCLMTKHYPSILLLWLTLVLSVSIKWKQSQQLWCECLLNCFSVAFSSSLSLCRRLMMLLPRCRRCSTNCVFSRTLLPFHIAG